MSKDGFFIDLSSFIRQLNATPAMIARGARNGMQDALNEWQAEARDEAPIGPTGSLRREIEQELKGSGLNIEGEMSNNVYNEGFNYAYWQHEVRGGSGLKYIDNTAEESKEKWLNQIKDDIKAELRRSGW